MHNVKWHVLIGLLPVFTLAPMAIAGPSAPISFTVEGTVESVTWNDRKLVRKGTPGKSGLAGHDFYSPSQYETTLKDPVFSDVKDEPSRKHVEKLKKADSVTLYLPFRKKVHYIKPDAKIKVMGYRIKDNEGAVSHRFNGIQSMPPPEPEKAEAEKPAEKK